MNPPQVYMCSPSWTLLPPPSPFHPSGSSQCTSPKQPVSCIEPGLATRFIHDILHVSMPFSQIFPYCILLILLFFISLKMSPHGTYQSLFHHFLQFHSRVHVIKEVKAFLNNQNTSARFSNVNLFSGTFFCLHLLPHHLLLVWKLSSPPSAAVNSSGIVPITSWIYPRCISWKLSHTGSPFLPEQQTLSWFPWLTLL